MPSDYPPTAVESGRGVSHSPRLRGIKDKTEVWTSYLTESEKHDKEMMEAYDRNMDFLLLFAGLFSAVLTGFTTVSYSQLQPPPSTETNLLLKGILHQLNNSLELGSLKNATVFSPSRAAIRLNILWFSSLTCSLLAAFGGVLAKQWMVEYPRGVAPSATPYERAQHRQIRYAGLSVWKFQAIIKVFPILIQIAFILFFIGLCQFLFILNGTIGWTIMILCILGSLFLLFSLFLQWSILTALTALHSVLHWVPLSHW